MRLSLHPELMPCGNARELQENASDGGFQGPFFSRGGALGMKNLAVQAPSITVRKCRIPGPKPQAASMAKVWPPSWDPGPLALQLLWLKRGLRIQGVKAQAEGFSILGGMLRAFLRRTLDASFQVLTEVRSSASPGRCFQRFPLASGAGSGRVWLEDWGVSHR